jgi:hypothetical protein
MIADSATRSVLMRSVEMRSPGFADRPRTRTAVATSPSATDAFLRRAADLRSNDVSRAVRAAGELSPDDCALAPPLIDLLAWDGAMPAAREALKRMGVKITGVLVDALLDTERDFVIRRRVPRVLVDLPSSRRVDGLFAALQDGRLEVRFHAGRALFCCSKTIRVFQFCPIVPGKQSTASYPCNAPVGTVIGCSIIVARRKCSGLTTSFWTAPTAISNTSLRYSLSCCQKALCGLPFARSTLTTPSLKEPLLSIWKVGRRRLRVNSCCHARSRGRDPFARRSTLVRSKTC